MAADTELESMVVRLVGDGSSYVKMLQDAQAQATRTAPVVEELFQKMERAAKSALGVVTQLGVGVGVWESFMKSAEAERNMVKLKAAIEGNGAAVTRTTEDYLKFAKAMSETTLISKGETLAMLKKAEAFGLTGEAAKKAAQQAIQLGAAGDVDAESALRVTAALNKGDIERAMHMARLIPQLRGIRDSTEFLTVANRLFATGQKTLAAEMETSSGQLEHMEHQLAAVTKEFGASLAIGIKPAVGYAKELTEKWTELDDRTKKLAMNLLALTAGVGGLSKVAPIAVAQMRALALACAANPYVALAAVVVGVGVAMHALAMETSGANKALDELNASLKRGKELRDAAASSRDTLIQEMVTKAKVTGDKSGLEAMAKDVDKSIAQAERDIEKFKAKVDEIGKSGGAIGRLLGIRSEDRDEAKRAMDEAKNRLEQAQKDKKELDKGINPLGIDKSQSLEVRNAVLDTTKKLKDMRDALGLTAEQAEVFKLKQMGATDAQLREAEAIRKEITEYNRLNKETEDIIARRKAIVDSIVEVQQATTEEIATMYMSASQIAVYKLQVKGATDGQLEMAKSLLATRDAWKAYHDLQDRAKQLTEQFASPLDKYKQKVQELQNVYEQGMVTTDIFNAGLKSAKDDLDSATKAAEGTKSAMDHLDATLNHTAASQAKVEDFLSKHRENVLATRSADRLTSELFPKSAGPANIGPQYPPGYGHYDAHPPVGQGRIGKEMVEALLPWLKQIAGGTGDTAKSLSSIGAQPLLDLVGGS